MIRRIGLILCMALPGVAAANECEVEDQPALSALARAVSEAAALPDGRYTERHANGKKAVEGTIKNGKKEGRWKIFDEDGTLWIEMSLANDVKHGPEKTYEDGKLVEQSTWVNGVEVAKTEWDYDGDTLEMISESRNGKRTRDLEYYEDGRSLWAEILYLEDGGVHEKLFHPNGKLASSVVLRSGRSTGVHLQWDDRGRLDSRTVYGPDGGLVSETLYDDSGRVTR